MTKPPTKPDAPGEDEYDVMDEKEAQRLVSVWSKIRPDLPSFRDIQLWSANQKKGPGTVYDAAQHFKVAPRVIVAIIKSFGPYPYFYIVGDGPHSKDMEFQHDGE